MHKIPAFLIGATTSGSGKTTLSLGIMGALKQRGFNVQPFKCGPDFIDPTLHTAICGNISRNLDLRMAGSAFCKNSFLRNIEGKDVAVVEGVMGLFDGGESSSAALAATLSLPVLLVIDARSAAESVAAVLKGFELYDPSIRISGVIFNRVGSSRHQELIRDAVTKHCTSEILGFFPRDAEFTIPERHLGLHMADEEPLQAKQVKNLVGAIEEHINIDQLLQLNMIRPGGKLRQPPKPVFEKRARLAIARDRAFCFYYQDNFDLLAQNGIDITFFSPLEDPVLPDGIDGIYIGGGYPELYAEMLSKNESIRKQIKTWAERGRPIFCECGGFMYLAERLIDLEGKSHAMAGVYPAVITMNNRLSRLGYREATLTEECMFGEKGDMVFGHEFHYSSIERMDSGVATVFALPDGQREGFTTKNVLGGYLHLHFGKSEKCLEKLHHFLLKNRGERDGHSATD